MDGIPLRAGAPDWAAGNDGASPDVGVTIACGVVPAPIWGMGPVDVLRFGEVQGPCAPT